MNSLPHNTFKERLARSERLIGLWVTFTGHPVAEVLGLAQREPETAAAAAKEA